MPAYEALRAAPLLEGLSDEQLRKFWAAGTVETVRMGDMIIREGEIDDTMYVLLEGTVSVSQALLLKLGKKDYGQKEKTLIRLDAHMRPCFGEMSLLEDSARSATVASLTESKVLVVDRTGFFAMVEEDPSLGVAVLRNIATTMSGRLRKANQDVLKLTTALSLALTS
jgi:CRP/FNR family transcriptional regulator, cyclic AMP receptor protein